MEKLYFQCRCEIMLEEEVMMMMMMMREQLNVETMSCVFASARIQTCFISTSLLYEGSKVVRLC